MRSLSRSDVESSLRMCRGAVRVVSLASALCAAVGCENTARPTEQPGEVPSKIGPWTSTRTRAVVPDPAADSGVGHAVPDAGQPAQEPQKPVDSGSPQPPAPELDAAIDTPSAEPATASIVLSAAPANGVPVQGLSSFSIAALPELYVYTAWSNLCGEHTELRKYYEPSGTLFYQKLRAFSTDIAEPVAFTRKVAVPHEQSVQPVSPNADGALVVEDYLGVTGTWIGDHSMTGSWKVELYLDDAKTPTATRSFELTP